MNFKEQIYTYDNGLKLIIVKTSGFYSAKMRIQFLAGSEDEQGDYGIAHLLEHSMFKGTKNKTQEQLAEAFNSLSATPNASTSPEFTSYSAKFPIINLQEVAKLFSEMLFESSFDNELLQKEKQVVIEEIKMHNDMPDSLVFDNLIGAMYKGCGLGNKVAGSKVNVQKATREDIINFKNNYYTAKNCIITVVGDVEAETIINLVKKLFVNKMGNKNGKQKNFSPAIKNKPKTISKHKNQEASNVCMGYYATNYLNFDFVKLTLISDILGGTMNSRLFVNMRNKQALCYTVDSQIVTSKNNGFMVISFVTSNLNLDNALNSAKNILNDVVINGVTDAEFTSAKNSYINEYLMRQDTPYVNLDYVAYTGRLFNKTEFIKKVKALTKQECEQAFKKYINPNDAFISVVC